VNENGSNLTNSLSFERLPQLYSILLEIVTTDSKAAQAPQMEEQRPVSGTAKAIVHAMEEWIDARGCGDVG
jgi:hypothetical protein